MSGAGRSPADTGSTVPDASDPDDAHTRALRLDAIERLAPVMVLTGTDSESWDHANARFLSLTGVCAEDPADRLWTRIFRAKAALRVQALLRHATPDGRVSRDLRLSLLLRRGGHRRCVLRVCRMPAAPHRWFATVTDVHRDAWKARRLSRMRDAVRDATVERDALVRQLVAAQEDERARIAAELHDHLGQNLTALRWALAGREGGSRTVEADRALEALVHDTDRRIERLMLALRPVPQGGEHLRESLAGALAEWSSQHGVRAEFEVGRDFPVRLPRHTTTTLHRIVLAALHNVARHAAATRVDVRLDLAASAVWAVIQDDGRGFDTAAVLRPAGPRRRSGTLAMEQRARVLGGTCAWESSPGQGTRVTVRIPHAPTRTGRSASDECE